MLSLGLDLWSSTILGRGADPYGVLGFRADLVFDFGTETYRTKGSPRTFDEAITYTGASNKTMVDSDGLLKWAPHNLLTYSETPQSGFTVLANATISSSGDFSTVTDDATNGDHHVIHGTSIPTTNIRRRYEVEVKGGTARYAAVGHATAFTATVNTFIFDTQVGAWTHTSSDPLYVIPGSFDVESLGDGWWLIGFESDLDSASYDNFVLGISSGPAYADHSYAGSGSTMLYRRPRTYRSDLGGMVDNPDRGDSYVPTTTAARYLPRRGHHVYNGSAWVNEGLLVESEARTNLLTYSQDFTNVAWIKTGTATLAVDATGPDGETSAVTLVDSGAGGSGTVYVNADVTVLTATSYTASVFAKADQLNRIMLYTSGFTTPANNGYVFNLTAGTYSAYNGTPAMTPNIQDFGGGWYRCSITFTTDAADTAGSIRLYIMDADGVGGEAVDLDGTSSILIYGAQLEVASTPSSYIPTSGATVTRAAETLTVAAADLPYPTPRVIGPELVTNGTFDTDSDWSKGTGWTIAGGVGVGTSVSLTSLNSNAFTTVVGRVYRVTFDLVSRTAGNVVLYAYDTSNIANSGSQLIPGTYSFTFVARQTSTLLFFYSTSSFSGSIDNVSVREIDPLSVSIQMQGQLNYADEDALVAYPFWWQRDAGNTIYTYLDTRGAETGQVVFVQGASSVIVPVNSSATTYAPGVSVPFNIASRHGSTFLNGAIDGVALTANTTPVALPDLSPTNLRLAYDMMGTIRLYRMWDQDLGNAGIAAASATWLLEDGYWEDTGQWVDTAKWNDGV